jgi:sugar lactone lactonase YvrE
VLTLAVLPGSAAAWIRSPATNFATLPPGSSGPEGLTVDAAGNVYVATFGFTASGPVPLSPPGHNLFVFAPSGRLLHAVRVSGSSDHLLGLGINPATGDLLVIDFGAGNVRKVTDVSTGASTVFMTVSGSPGLNAMTFDSAGNVYVSDSFQGIIWRVPETGGAGTPWVSDPLLTTTGFPPFGANGLAFNKSEAALFVANTGNDTMVKIPVSGSPLTPGTPAVFVNSINGADGLITDDEDNLWVAANQADEIVVVDPTGRVIAKLGDFGGIDPHGAPRGLFFPATPFFGNGFVYVTNLALDLRLFDLPQAVDSQWAAQVTTYTVSKIPARIPPIAGLP